MCMVKPQVNLEIFNKTAMDHMHSEMTVEVKILTASRAVVPILATPSTNTRGSAGADTGSSKASGGGR